MELTYMELTDIEFNYKQGSDYGTGLLTVSSPYDYCHFYFEFSAFQDHDCSYSCHSSTQEQPDEDYFEYDVIDKILYLDELVQKIKTTCNEDISEDELDNLIRDEFYKKESKERYLYTREG